MSELRLKLEVVTVQTGDLLWVVLGVVCHLILGEAAVLVTVCWDSLCLRYLKVEGMSEETRNLGDGSQ